MSLPLTNNFETALADETTITDVNSADGAAGSPFDAVNILGASTLVYDTARAAHGTLSARFVLDAANGVFLEWDASVGTQTTEYGRLYIYRTAAPTPDDLWLVQPLNAADANNALIRLRTDGKLDVFDSTLGSSSASVNNFPLNEWVRIEWKLVCSATVGIIEAKTFHADSASAIETITLSSCNTLTNTTKIWIGQGGANAPGSTFWLDDLVLNNTGYPGPAATAPSTSTGGLMMLGVG